MATLAYNTYEGKLKISAASESDSRLQATSRVNYDLAGMVCHHNYAILMKTTGFRKVGSNL